FGVVFTVLGIAGSWLFREKRALYSNIGVAICGAALYFILLFITWLGFDRMITEELFLITGWLVMVLIEINALYVHGRLKRQTAVSLVIICLALAIVSYICYVLYYDLGTLGRFIDGILPLLLCGFGMIGTITVLAAFPRPVTPQKPYRSKDCIPKSD
ncbi:MAG: hypothetical protein LUB61_03105, partial [Eggerthellaceae bacterium]|nr:hypothetical protein [Eggerthellaceae bacterium]